MTYVLMIESINSSISRSRGLLSEREMKVLSDEPHNSLEMLKSKFEVLSEDMSYYQLSNFRKLTAFLYSIASPVTRLFRSSPTQKEPSLEPKIFIDMPQFERCLIYLSSIEKNDLVVKLITLYPMPLSVDCFNALLYLSRKTHDANLERHLIDKFMDTKERVKSLAKIAASFGDIKLLNRVQNRYGFSLKELYGSDSLSVANYLLAEAAASNQANMVNHLLMTSQITNDGLALGLAAAAGQNHFEMVVFFLNKGVRVYSLEYLSLIWAASNGHIDMVKYLQSKGTDIVCFVKEALRRAVLHGHIKMVDYLLRQAKEGCSNHEFIEIKSYIQTCSMNANLEMIQYFQRMNIKLSISTWRAIEKNDGEIYDYLLSRLDKPLLPFQLQAHVKHAVTCGQLNMLIYLMSKYRYLKFDIDELLYLASLNGHIAVFKYLQTLCADIHYNHRLLNIAIEQGHVEMVRYLQHQGIMFNEDNRASIIGAVKKGHLDMVKYLMSQGIDLIGDSRLLELAIVEQQLEVVQYFIKLGVFRPLNRYLEIVKLLASSFNIHLRKICSEELDFLGFTQVDLKLTRGEFEEAICESIALGPIPYKTAGGEVFRAIIIENELKAVASDVGFAGFESAMDDSLMRKARDHFDNIIFKDADLNSRLVSSGGIEAVEAKIKVVLLEHLKSIPAAEAFLTPEKVSAILAGDRIERIALLNLIQDNNEDVAAIAYRAYEPLAKTVDWPNLFTEPSDGDANHPVYAIALSLNDAQRGTAVVQSMASDEIRKMSVYTFLLALRQLEKGDHTVFQDWISYVAEIRRAHNNSQKGVDNPSCYPGSVTRIAQVLKSTAIKMPATMHQEIKELIRQAMIRAFSSHLSTLHTNEEKIKFYDAITALHYDYDEATRKQALIKIFNKRMILSGGDEWRDSEYLPIRAEFIQRQFGDINDAVNNMLVSISENDIVIPLGSQSEVVRMIKKAFIQITHLEAIGSMNAAMIKSLGLKDEPEPKSSEIQNPYFFYNDFETCYEKCGQNLAIAKRSFLENNLKYKLFDKAKGFFNSGEDAQVYVTELYFTVKEDFENNGMSFDIEHLDEISSAMEALFDNDDDFRQLSSKTNAYLPLSTTNLLGHQFDQHEMQPKNGNNKPSKKKANKKKKRGGF